MNKNTIRFISGVILVLVWSCSPKVQTQVLTPEESSVFYADFEVETVVYHASDDSTDLYMRFPASFLSNKKWNNTRDYRAIHLNLMVTDSLQRMIDTVEADYHGFDVTDQQWVMMHERLGIRKGSYKVIIEISDLNKNMVSKEVVHVDKQSTLGSQNFLLKDESGQPVFGQRVKKGATVVVESNRNANVDSIEVFQFQQDTKLPPPPFSSNALETPEVKQATRMALALRNGRCTLQQQGLYQCCRVKGSSTSFLIRQQIHQYPAVDQPQQLHFPLRYITTKAEYDEMNKSSYSKPLVDKFWIESGGSKDRARELIKRYYERVEESNRYFTSYTEGWRTDRGMIYLVYGPPTMVEHNEQQEMWHYDSGSEEGDMVFVFNRVKTPIGLVHYQLKRAPYYKAGWEMMVNSWRNGRVR